MDAEENRAADTAAPTVPRDAPADFTFDGHGVSCDLPPTITVTREEIALLRAFLGTEIEAILFEHGSIQGEQ